MKKFSYAEITQATKKRIQSLTEMASNCERASDSTLYKNAAWGVYLGWQAVTLGWQNDGDDDAMATLADSSKK